MLSVYPMDKPSIPIELNFSSNPTGIDHSYLPKNSSRFKTRSLVPIRISKQGTGEFSIS